MKTKSILFTCLLATAVLIAQAQNVFLTEHFNYPADSALQSNGWFAHSAGGTNPILVTNGGLAWSATNYFGSGVGNAAAVNNTGSDENRPLSSYVNSGHVYISFLAKVKGAVTSTNGGVFFHTGEYSNTATPVFTAISSAFRARTHTAPGSTADKFRFGLSFNSATITNTVGTDATPDLDTGQTYLVVIKYSFYPGASNDSVSMYVFADGDNIAIEPASPTIGPLGGTQSDLSFVQFVALRQFHADQDITVDGIIVQDAWNLAPLPLGGSTLISPPDNTILPVSGPAATPATITWTSAQNATGTVNYVWQLASRAAGNFSNPLLSIPSNLSGTDTNLTLSFSQIDAALGSLGVSIGDTVKGIWRVLAISGGDTVFSVNTFNIDIIRGVVSNPLSAFNLVSPPNNTSLNITGAGAQTATISWTASNAGAQAIDYQWLAIAAGGNFSNPVLDLPSDNMGMDTTLTLTFSAIDAVLASLGIAVGDSITVEWTVKANAGAATLFATQTWVITLIRGGLLSTTENIFDNQITIYPNPATNQVSIDLGNIASNKVNISLINQFGQEVIRVNQPETANQKVELNTEKLSSGIYFINIENGQARTTRRLVIQR